MSEYGYYDSYEDQRKQEAAFSLAKVFGYMFAGLLITVIVMFGLALLFHYLFPEVVTDAFYSAPSEGEESANTLTSNAGIFLLVILIVSFIGLIAMSATVNLVMAREKHSILVPAIIYSVLMGVALSTIAIFVPWYLLGVTFGITCIVFGMMSVIALLSKGKLNGLAMAGIGLVIGGSLLGLLLWVLSLFMTIGYLFYIVSFAVFAGMMLITIWDIARIKNIAQQGEMSSNLSLYCAYILYVDFIYLFIRLLRWIIIIAARSK